MTDSTSKNKSHTCPHCGSELKGWQTPEDSSWGGELRLVCFNDDCPYFVRGWDIMMERQCVSCSYRHMLDPKTGYTGPVPVWSKDALKESIVSY